MVVAVVPLGVSSLDPADGEDETEESLAAGVGEVASIEANVDEEAGDSLTFSSGCSEAGVGWFRLRSDERPRN